MAGGGPMVRLCPDGTVPLVVCDECRAVVLARDLEAHAEWHRRLAGGPDVVRTLGGQTLEDRGRC